MYYGSEWRSSSNEMQYVARYSACAIGRARALQRGCACAIRTKWRLRTSGNAGRALSFRCICSKGSSSIGYRVDWCKNHRLQSNQFVGRPDEEEEVTSQTLRNNMHAQERAPPIYVHRSSRPKPISSFYSTLPLKGTI